MELKDQLQSSKVSSVQCKTYPYREKKIILTERLGF